jgi:hypothetical protein
MAKRNKDKAAQEIKRVWGDVQVVDAEKDLRVLILPEDVDHAIRHDEAQACRRTFGASKVLFWRSVAYVELPKEDGVTRVERFIMPSSMRSLVEAFDRGQDVIPKAGFILKAPTAGRRLDYGVRKEYLRRHRQRQKLEGKAERRGNQGVGRYRDKPLTVDLAVRNGTGAVHFTPAAETESD